MARALEELIDSGRSVCEDPRKFIENKLFDTLKALKPASETWLFLKDALVLQGASAKHSTVKLGEDRFEVITLHDKRGNLVKEYSFVELPEGETVTLDDFEGLLKDGIFEFGFSESKPKTYFKNFLDEVKNARKQDVTKEFKQDLDNSLLSMYVPIAAATGKKNFAKVVDLMKEHEPELYDILKATCNIKFNSPENIADALYDNLTEQAKQILLSERKEHKKELADIIDLPVYTRVANVAKNVVANGLIWTPILAIVAGMAGLTAIAPHAVADNSPEKPSSRETNPIKITNMSGVETLWGWSPDGQKILFSSEGDLYAVNSDGNGLEHLVAKPNGSTAIEFAKYDTPGKRIAFLVRDNTNGKAILSVRDVNSVCYFVSSDVKTYSWDPRYDKIAYIDSGNNLHITDVSNPQNQIPKFNSSGIVSMAWLDDMAFVYKSSNQKLVYVSLLSSDPETGWLLDKQIDSSDILQGYLGYIYYVSNGNLVKGDFTDFGKTGEINKTTLASFDGTIKSMSISPDKSKIAFYLDKDGDYSVYVINTDGSQLKKISNNLNHIGKGIPIYSAPHWSPDSKFLTFQDMYQEVSQTATFIAKANGGIPTKIIQGMSLSDENDLPLFNPKINTLAFALLDGDIYTQSIDGNNIGWTSAQLEKIKQYAPAVMQDSRRDTAATQTYLPADPHGDNTDVQDNHENYDADASKFSSGSNYPVYVKVTEYPSDGFDIYTYVYYRTENPHWIGFEAFKHEHDVQRVHVKVDRLSGKATEVAYSQHNWIVKQAVKSNSDLTFYSEWGGHEYWKFSWNGADGKGKNVNSANTEFKPLDEIVNGVDADKDGKYKTNEQNLPTSPPPKVPWLYSDVQDPKSAFEPFGGKMGALTAELQSSGSLSVILDSKTTSATNTDIPNSFWQNNSIGILGTDQTDTPTLKVMGTEQGTYGISGTLVADKPYTINFDGVPIKTGEVHTYRILSWKDYADGKPAVNWTIQKDGKTYSRNVMASEITAAKYTELTKEQPKPPPNGNQTKPADNTPVLIGAGVGIGIGIGVGGYFAMRRRRQQPPLQTAQTPQVQPTYQQETQQQIQTPQQDLYSNDYAARQPQSWQTSDQDTYAAEQQQEYPQQEYQEQVEQAPVAEAKEVQQENLDDVLRKLKEN
jgi:Tol biopolymer transport system component